MAADPRPQWSDDAFLDRLRDEGDRSADDCLEALASSQQNFSELFRFLNANDVPVPESAPAALRSFLARSDRMPTPDGVTVDRARLKRGEDVFMTHACSSALVLLSMSLPAGYAAPNLARVLVMSGNLKNHPYKRLLGVLQMVVNVTSRGGFEPSGKAVVTAAKLRLLHAGVRQIVRRRLPGYEARYGVPVNHEDMLATIMGFSLLVVRGLQELGVGLGEQEAEDYYYLWRVFALSMGIHPPGAPDSMDYIPATIGEADAFYAAYGRRHYRAAGENPEGVELTRASLLMLAHLIGETPLRLLGARLVPRVYMQELLGADGLVQRGVQPVTGHAVVRVVLLTMLRVWTRFWLRVDRDGASHVHERLGQLLFEGLIERTLQREVAFLIPESLADLHALTENIIRPHGERRRGPRRLTQIAAGVADRRVNADRRSAFRQAFWGNAAH